MRIRLIEIFVLTIATSGFLLGLVSPTELVTSILTSIFFAVLCFAAVASFTQTTKRKYFWRGFLAVSVVYLGIIGFISAPGSGSYYDERPTLVTDIVIEKSFPIFHRETMAEWETRVQIAPVVGNVPFGSGGPGGVFSIPELPQVELIKSDGLMSQCFFFRRNYSDKAVPFREDIRVPERFATNGHLLFTMWFAWLGGHLGMALALRQSQNAPAGSTQS